MVATILGTLIGVAMAEVLISYWRDYRARQTAKRMASALQAYLDRAPATTSTEDFRN